MALIRPEPPREPENRADHLDDRGQRLQQGMPIGAYYQLLDKRIYVQTQKKMIALCALKSRYRNELKLYEWKWRGEEKGWKVALANFRIESLDLEQIARDARVMARKHGIKLDWI